MTLSNLEKNWARIVGRAFMPLGVLGGLTDQLDFGFEISGHLGRSPWYAALVVRLALLCVWFAPLVVLGRFARFGALPAAEQVACLEKLIASRRYLVRQLLMLLKLTVSTVAIGQEDVLRYLGAYKLDAAAGSRRAS